MLQNGTGMWFEKLSNLSRSGFGIKVAVIVTELKARCILKHRGFGFD